MVDCKASVPDLQKVSHYLRLKIKRLVNQKDMDEQSDVS